MAYRDGGTEMAVSFSCALHGWRAYEVPCPICEPKTMLADAHVGMRLSAIEHRLMALEAAQGIETRSAGTVEQGPARKGESPVLKEDAPKANDPSPPLVPKEI